MRPAALVAPPILRAEPPDGERVSSQVNDAQMTAVLSAIVQTQIAQANVARSKSDDNRVAEFAVAIIAQRTAIRSDLRDSASTLPHGVENSELLQRVHDDAQGVTATMATLTGTAFDAAYVAGQIREYQNAIALLDTRIADVQSPELRGIATQLRNTLVKNLIEARVLRGELVAAQR